MLRKLVRIASRYLKLSFPLRDSYILFVYSYYYVQHSISVLFKIIRITWWLLWIKGRVGSVTKKEKKRFSVTVPGRPQSRSSAFNVVPANRRQTSRPKLRRLDLGTSCPAAAALLECGEAREWPQKLFPNHSLRKLSGLAGIRISDPALRSGARCIFYLTGIPLFLCPYWSRAKIILERKFYVKINDSICQRQNQIRTSV